MENLLVLWSTFSPKTNSVGERMKKDAISFIEPFYDPWKEKLAIIAAVKSVDNWVANFAA